MRARHNVLIFFLLLFGASGSAMATHLMGVDITYTCLNSCTIRVEQRVYRDCAGATGVGIQNFAWGAAAGCTAPTMVNNWLPCSNAGQVNCWVVTEVTPVCPGTVTQCQNAGSSIRGVQEYYRYSDWNICNTNCSSYTIEWTAQNRNGGITSGAANQGLGSFVTTVNTSLSSCNSSPQFNNPPVPYFCQGQPFTFNQGATDPDGDSLSYSLGPCFDDTQTQIIYNPGFTPTQPLGASWNVVVNPTTGDVSFVPQPGNVVVAVMCVYVQEWRNGIMINQIVRDMQINVIPCPNNFLPAVPSVSNIQNGTGFGGSATGVFVGTCLGNSLCFNLPVVDANPTDSVTIWWSQNIPGGQFFQAGNPSVQDTITGVNPQVTFCWTPTAAGSYSFLVEMRDNACPSYGFSQFTVTIIVSNPVVNLLPPILACDTVNICASPVSGIPTFYFQWTGQGGLAANATCVTHVYPGPGTYNYQVVMSDSAGCRDTATGSVVIPVTPTANAGPDQLFCTPGVGSLGVPPSPGVTYDWEPSTYLSNGNVSNPTFNIVNPGLTPIVMTYVLTATDLQAGCVDRDTVTVVVSYPPQLTFNPTQVLCYGTPTGAIDMTAANGFLPLDFQWNGPNGFSATTEDINNLYAGQYLIEVSDSAGCVSRDTILVSQPPTPLWINVLPTPSCCYGLPDGGADLSLTGDSPPYNYAWTGPGGFSSSNEDLQNVPAGTYYIQASDAIGCVISDSVVIAEPAPVLIDFTAYNVACNGETNGIVDADVSGGHGNFSYLWAPSGSTTDSITGLGAGNHILTVSDTCFGPSTALLYWEDFEGHSPWTLNVPTGVNGIQRNFWTVSDATAGVAPPGCSTSGTGDSTLLITNIINPNSGANYLNGANNATSMRAESPGISTLGFSNLTLSFDFTSVGSGVLDNCALLYNVGGGWLVLNPSLKSGVCAPGQGQWQNFSVALPATANNIPNLQVGFAWVNNADGVGSNPSVAINNIQVVAPKTVTTSICTIIDTSIIDEPTVIATTLAPSNNPCFGDALGSVTTTPTGGNGNFSYLWSNGSTAQNPTGLAAGMYIVTVTDTAYTPAGGPAGFLTCTHIDTVFITEPLPISLSASNTPTSCFLGSDGTTTVSVSGGTAGYTFLWNSTPSQTTQTAVGLPTGAYTVTVTDANGCQDSISTVVAQPSPVAAVTSMTNSRCGNADGTATVVASGGNPGYTYQWSTNPVQTTPTAIGLLAGPYIVTVTDANGCPTTASITVGNEPRPHAFIVNQTNNLCFGDANGTALASAAGGRPPYLFSWSNGQSTPGATGLPAGVHSVQVVDSFGCRDTAEVTITEPPLLTGTTIVQDMGCMSVSPDGTIGVVPSGGTPGYSFLWNMIPLQSSQYVVNVAPGIYTVTITDHNGCKAILTDTVIQIPRPDVTANPGGAFCEGEGGFQISATSSGGSLPHYYSWWCNQLVPICALDSVNDNDPIANPDSSNWYYVMVTDLNGCRSDTDSVFVTVLPKPIVDAGPDHVICGDSAPCTVLTPTILGTAPGPYTYHWFPGNTLNDSTIANPCARPDTSTIYTLLVTSGNGCTSDFTTTDTLSTVAVNVNPIPIGGAGPDHDICFGDTVMLQGTGSGAGPDYTYEWSPATGLSDSSLVNPLASPASTIDYAFTVWSNGCPSYGDTLRVNVHTLPTLTAGWDREICPGDTTLLDAQASGDSTATYTFQWFPSSNLPGGGSTEDVLANPDSTTTYWVVATSSWGCESAADSATVFVKPAPVVDAGANITLCSGDSTTLAATYSYSTADTAPASQIYFSWTPSNTMNDSTLQNPTVWPSESGWYHVDLRYNTCSTSDSVLVVVIPGLNANMNADTNVICEGESVQLTSNGGNGGATFTWFPETGLDDPHSSSPVATPTETTEYTLVVAQGGCADTFQVNLEVIPRPEVSYLSSFTEGCIPLTVSFIQTSSDDISYVWDFGDGSPVSNEPDPTHTYDLPGNYAVSLTVSNEGGCSTTWSGNPVSAVDTPHVAFSSNPPFPVEMSLPVTEVQFQNESTNAISFHWDFGDGIQSQDLQAVHTYSEAGIYFVTLVGQNAAGCIGRAVGGPYVVRIPDLFVPNVFSPNGDGINDVFWVEYSGSQPFLVKVFDRWGSNLYTSNNRTLSWDGKDSKGNPAPDGVYFYHVTIGGKEFVGEVTLMR